MDTITLKVYHEEAPLKTEFQIGTLEQLLLGRALYGRGLNAETISQWIHEQFHRGIQELSALHPDITIEDARQQAAAWSTRRNRWTEEERNRRIEKERKEAALKEVKNTVIKDLLAAVQGSSSTEDVLSKVNQFLETNGIEPVETESESENEPEAESTESGTAETSGESSKSGVAQGQSA